MTKRPRDSTTELVSRARRGDATAANVLAGRERAQLQRYAHGKLPRFARDICDTEDIVQDAMLHAWERIDTLDVSKPGNLGSYTRRTVKNGVVDQVRRALRRPRADLADLPDARPSPEADAAWREVESRRRAVLARLTPKDQRLITDRIDREREYDEIAREHGKPSFQAARVAVHRACKRFLAALKDDPAFAPADRPRARRR